MMFRVYIMFGIISVSRALSKSNSKEKVSLEVKLWCVFLPFQSSNSYCCCCSRRHTLVYDTKASISMWHKLETKKVFSLSLLLTHPLYTWWPPPSQVTNIEIFSCFFCHPSNTHSRHISFLLLSIFFFNNNFSALLLKSFSILCEDEEEEEEFRDREGCISKWWFELPLW